jgi:hypothetical protein
MRVSEFDSEVAIMCCETSESLQISTLSRLKSFFLLKYDGLISYIRNMPFVFTTAKILVLDKWLIVDRLCKAQLSHEYEISIEE